MDYYDFLLRISPAAEPGRFVVTAKSVTAGEASSLFASPFSETELENFVLRIGLTRRGVRKIQSPEWRAAQSFGQKLYSTLFVDDIRATYLASRNDALREGKGLRVKVIVDAPALANYPWEFLYDSSLNRFLSLYEGTPVVRYVELSAPPQVLRVAPPLRVLVLASSPADYPPLDVAREKNNLDSALAELVQQNQITVDWLPNASLEGLRAQLLKRAYHIFHFIGHGGFDEAAQDGLLILEDQFKRGRRVSGERLAVLLGNHATLRVAILNSCEGARTSVQDPFAGTALTLVKSGGLSAVVAMQFEITDEASIAFARGFYSALAAGNPVDAAVTQARLAIFAEDNDVEWGTPVLYLRAPDGVIFAPLSPEEIAELERKRAELERRERERKEAERLAQEKAEAERAAREQAEKERLAREREEAERLAREKAEAERLAREQAERARVSKVAELYRAAQQSFAQNQFADAIKSLESLLALDVSYAAALELMSKTQAAQAEQERLAKAQAERAAQEQAEKVRLALEKAEREREAQIANLLRAAQTSFAQQNYRETIRTAEQILTLDPNNTISKELQAKARQQIELSALARPATTEQSSRWIQWAREHARILGLVSVGLLLCAGCSWLGYSYLAGLSSVRVVATTPTLFLSACKSISDSQSTSEWPMKGYAAGNTYWNRDENVLRPPLKQLWTYMPSPDAPGVNVAVDSLTVANGIALISSGVADKDNNQRNVVFAADAQTGKQLWKFALTTGRGSMDVSPAVCGGLAFFGGQSDNNLYAANVNTGRIQWQQSGVGDLFSRSPKISSGILYAMGYSIWALEPQTGRQIWTLDKAAPSSIAIDQGVLLRGGVITPLAGIDQYSGKILWQGTGKISRQLIAADGIVYAAYTGDSSLQKDIETEAKKDTEAKYDRVAAFRVKDGAKVWETNVPVDLGFAARMALADDILCIGTWSRDAAATSILYSINSKTGEILNQRAGFLRLATIISGNGVLYTCSYERGPLYALDPRKLETIWQSDTSFTCDDLVIAGGRLYVANGWAGLSAFGNAR